MPAAARRIAPVPLAVPPADPRGHDRRASPQRGPSASPRPNRSAANSEVTGPISRCKRVEPPAVKGRPGCATRSTASSWPSSRKLDWSHAPEADRVALIRRVTFDLTGLPPVARGGRRVPRRRPAGRLRAARRSPARQPPLRRALGPALARPGPLRRFQRLRARRRAARRLALSRLGRPDALNADLPYDRFLELQIAGDELQPGDRDALIATGFCRCGPREVVGGNVIPEVKRQSELTEITGTVGSVFLGLTIGCARCHDHKFDAIPTTDYYRLQAFFAASELTTCRSRREAEREAFEAVEKAIEAKVAPLREAARRARGALSRGDQGPQADHAQCRGTGRDEYARETTDAAQKKLAQGLETSLRITWEEVAAAVAANPDRADHARRECSSERSTRSSGRSLGRRPMRWPWSTRSRR